MESAECPTSEAVRDIHLNTELFRVVTSDNEAGPAPAQAYASLYSACMGTLALILRSSSLHISDKPGQARRIAARGSLAFYRRSAAVRLARCEISGLRAAAIRGLFSTESNSEKLSISTAFVG